MDMTAPPPHLVAIRDVVRRTAPGLPLYVVGLFIGAPVVVLGGVAARTSPASGAALADVGIGVLAGACTVGRVVDLLTAVRSPSNRVLLRRGTKAARWLHGAVVLFGAGLLANYCENVVTGVPRGLLVWSTTLATPAFALALWYGLLMCLVAADVGASLACWMGTAVDSPVLEELYYAARNSAPLCFVMDWKPVPRPEKPVFPWVLYIGRAIGSGCLLTALAFPPSVAWAHRDELGQRLAQLTVSAQFDAVADCSNVRGDAARSLDGGRVRVAHRGADARLTFRTLTCEHNP